MPYPESILAADEDVVERFHPHWITLVRAALWFLLICAVVGAVIAFLPDHGLGRTILLWGTIVVAVGLFCWLTLAPWVRWKFTHYIFTSYRVLVRRGVFTHTGRDIALQRITDVAFRQTLWDRIVGAGTLIIESAGEQGNEVLHDIPDSNDQQQLLNKLIEEDHRRRARDAYGGQRGASAQEEYPQTRQYPPV